MDILIADDSPVTLKFLQKVLEGWGHTVISSKDGADAWNKVQDQNAPKLCIIDWDMPALTGIEVCKKIRESKLDRYVIILTAKDDVLDIQEGLEHGADDYICKPFRQEELSIRIRAAAQILNLEKRLEVSHDTARIEASA